MFMGYYVYSLIERGLQVIEKSDSKTVLAFVIGAVAGSYLTRKYSSNTDISNEEYADYIASKAAEKVKKGE